MSDATSLQADISGVGVNGAPEPWRVVFARHPRNIGDIVNDPNRGEWNSTHNGQVFQGTYDAFEQQVTTAEQIAWVRRAAALRNGHGRLKPGAGAAHYL